MLQRVIFCALTISCYNSYISLQLHFKQKKVSKFSVYALSKGAQYQRNPKTKFKINSRYIKTLIHYLQNNILMSTNNGTKITFHYTSTVFSIMDFFHSESLDSGLWPSSGILNNKKTQSFGNWICFHPQVKGGRERERERAALLGPSESPNSNHW
jgi:hypothetical protein